MLQRVTALTPRELAKWCFYTLALLAPGSFAVLAVLWLARLCRFRRRPNDYRAQTFVPPTL